MTPKLLLLVSILSVLVVGCGSSPTAEELDNEGVSYFQNGEYDRAIAAFDKAIAKNPLLAAAYLHRAQAYVSTGGLEAAAADYEKAVELGAGLEGAIRTDLVRIYKELADAAHEAEDFASALVNFDKLLTLNPDDAPALRSRGDVFFALGNMRDADRDYSKASELNPALADQLTIRRAITAGTFDLATAGATAPFSFVDPSESVLYVIPPKEAEIGISKAVRGASWSPDGSKIAFGCDVQLCVTDFAGARQATWQCNTAWTPTWSPTGDQLAAICYDNSARVVFLGVFTPAAGDVTRILTFGIDDPAVAGFMHDRSAWSADGRSILYVRCIQSAQFCNLYAADVGSGRERMVLENAEYGVWSPDGQWVAATRAVSFMRVIIVAAADGTGASRLADGWAPAWSPDSRRLAFQRRDGLRIVDIVTGSEVTVLAPSIYNCQNCPPLAWSPDGTRLAAQAILVGSNNVGREEIRVYDALSGFQVGISFPGRYPVWGSRAIDSHVNP